jgi:hypothetical protein
LLAGSQVGKPGDFRARLPRFAPEHAEQNQRLVQAFAAFAAAHGLRPATLAVAWPLAKGEHIVPVIGARTRAQLADALAGAEVSLSPEDVASLETAVPASAVAGTRYDAHQMRSLDTERQFGAAVPEKRRGPGPDGLLHDLSANVRHVVPVL